MQNKKGKIAITQILILVIGIVAIGYAIGSEVGFVRGAIRPDNNQPIFHSTPTKRPPVLAMPTYRTPPGERIQIFERKRSPAIRQPTESQESIEPPEENIIEAASGVDSVEITSALKPFLGETVSITTTTGLCSTGCTGVLTSVGEGYQITDATTGISTQLTASEISGLNAEGIWTGYGTGFLGNIAQGAWWALMVYGAVQMVGNIFDVDEAYIDAASKAAALGMLVGKTAIGGVQQWGNAIWLEQTGWWGVSKGAWLGGGIGIAVAVTYYYTQYEEEEQKIVIFNCYSWDAPVGGDYCETCNKQGILPCSEYQCRSLGQACQLLNPGTDEEKCFWVNRNDIEYPIIKPLDEALREDYIYTPDKTISPPDRGVLISNKEAENFVTVGDKKMGCTEAFTPLSFGVTLDEPAKCKIDYLRKDTFDDMEFYFGESSLKKYNHTQVMSLPGSSEEGLTIENDGNFELYVRCQDENGNYNTANFVFKFCVDQGPDTTPPLIVTTDPLNNMPIQYEQTSFPVAIYVNEPVECKWSHLDQSYENMPDENQMSKLGINAQGLYPLTTELTGLKNEVENKFYFRCNDSSGNINAKSQPEGGFVLFGTRPLVIDWVKPENESIIKDSTDVVKVTLEARTSAGYKDGEATCEFGETSDWIVDDKFTPFLTYEHSYELWLTEGEYEYFIRCYDLGGNSDQETINFKVETDGEEPVVVRVYHDGSDLKLVTNEEAECVYDTTRCLFDFDKGIKMNTLNKINHYTDWNTQTNFYIKCKDSYDNKPFPQKCSIIVKPAQIF